MICNLDKGEIISLNEEYFEIDRECVAYVTLEKEVNQILFPSISSLSSLDNVPKSKYPADFQLRICFSQFFAKIVKNYRKFIIVIQQDPLLWVFHTQKYVKSHPEQTVFLFFFFLFFFFFFVCFINIIVNRKF